MNWIALIKTKAAQAEDGDNDGDDEGAVDTAGKALRKTAVWIGRSFRSTFRVSALPVGGDARQLVFFVCAATESGLTRSLQTAPTIAVDLA